MRAYTLISILAAGAAVAVAGWGSAAPKPEAVFADKSPNAIPVDVELVIAVDVSNSMDPEEQALQREGYILGLTSREFLQALRNGNHGRIAITYFEWAGLYDQKIILPWRLIDGPESAAAVTNEIKGAPYRRAPRTSIFGALQFAKPLFDSSGYGGLRRVIDVSGDGSNNMGPPVTIMRCDSSPIVRPSGCRSSCASRSKRGRVVENSLRSRLRITVSSARAWRCAARGRWSSTSPRPRTPPRCRRSSS